MDEGVKGGRDKRKKGRKGYIDERIKGTMKA